MPTRPRTGSGRTKKTAAPVTRATFGRHLRAATEVTAANLERREIPSFSESREARIAEAAYWRAERRGFTAGQELDDWLAAEKEVDGDIATQQVAPQPEVKRRRRSYTATYASRLLTTRLRNSRCWHLAPATS